MDCVHFGTTFRAIRLELGLRQADVAARAGISQQTVSRVERGRFGPVSTSVLKAAAEAIEADLTLGLRWRGPKLARLLDRRHAHLQDRAVRLLSNLGWEVRVEESFNRFGERGSVDILAWRADRRALLVVEIKSELVDLQETIRTLDMKARVVPTVVRGERGWAPEMVAAVLVLPDANVHRSVVARHAAMLAVALPARTREVRRWVVEPSGPLRGIWFLPNTHPGSAVKGRGCTQRMSRKRKTPLGASTGAVEHPTSVGVGGGPVTGTATRSKSAASYPPQLGAST
jgi:transcriptional regulator with XRE-family HTH domain